MESKIYIGTAGWDYPDWKNIVYTNTRGRKVHHLETLAKWFDCCEVNSSFYAIPDPDSAKKWLGIISFKKEFLLNMKLYQKFTHEKKLRPEEVSAFKQTASVLLDEGRLGVLLAQFPWSFKASPENLEYLDKLLGAFEEFPIAVEIRHDSWNNSAFIEFLKERDTAFCNIDQPELKNNLPMTSCATSDTAYFRFHGRRKDTWFKDNEGQGFERYNYLYSMNELSPWVDAVKELYKKLSKTFVITNNHYRGKAVANAMQMKNMIEGTKFSVPQEMLVEYPDLKTIADGPPIIYEEMTFL